MAWSPSPVYCTKKLAGRTCQPRRESHKAASKTVTLNTHLLINSFHHILIKQHTLFMALLIKGLKYLLMNLILSKTMPTCMTSFLFIPLFGGKVSVKMAGQEKGWKLVVITDKNLVQFLYESYLSINRTMFFCFNAFQH